MKKDRSARVEFGGEAVYRIVVQGAVPEKFHDRLSGMSIETQTTLVGELRDQSDLTGVLNTLHSLHLPILRVKIEEAGNQPKEHESEVDQ